MAQASVDSAWIKNHSYLHFVDENDPSAFELDDETFYDHSVSVHYKVDKYALVPGDPALAELKDQVIPLINSTDYRLVRVVIRGAASPEGPRKFNEYLAEKRAETLLKFLNSHLTVPIGKDKLVMDSQTGAEDYRTLCLLMQRAGDADYERVKAICDKYLPTEQFDSLKTALMKCDHQRLFWRLHREYFRKLRAARVNLFFAHVQAPEEPAEPVVEEVKEEPVVEEVKEEPTEPEPVVEEVKEEPTEPKPVVEEVLPEAVPEVVKVPRREVLSVKSNLLFDVAYVPGYDRWCPIPNVAVEFYPRKGHFTYGASIDFPWWQHYWKHKYFQIRNYQVESRYYFRSGSIDKNPPGEGAAFRGFYLQGYAHAALFGICFGPNRGWVGEGLGGGIGAGYVMPLTKSGHWRLEFGAQVGYFACRYDPYQFENPVNPNYVDHLYYYKWTLSPDLFKKRQYHFNWFGPTRIGVTLTYDLLYKRVKNKGVSFRSWEKTPIIKPLEGGSGK